jgi:DNA-directed RNA polymerase subunit RPC12/RpoP
MKLKTANCTYCGANLTLSPDKDITKCRYCQNQIIVKNAFELSKVEVDKTKDIVNLRSNLRKYVKIVSFKEIIRTSGQLIDLIPDDAIANYYFSFAKQNLHEPKYAYDFYNSDNLLTDNEIEEIITHIINNCDLRDKNRVASFINRYNSSKLAEFETIFNKRSELEDNYADIPRDLFIAYSKEDETIVKKVVDALEEDGNTCWVAYRNLRPNDIDNYWDNITRAIKSSRALVIVSSKASMLSKDVQKELDKARELEKSLIEFNIDNSRRTTLFKHIFDGIKWVDGYTNLNKGIEDLYKRVYLVLNNENINEVESEDNIEGIDQEIIEDNNDEDSKEECPNCETKLQEGWLYCYNCGEGNPKNLEMPNQENIIEECPNCETKLEEGWLFCYNCGESNPNEKTETVTQPNKESTGSTLSGWGGLILIIILFFIPGIGWIPAAILLSVWLKNRSEGKTN